MRRDRAHAAQRRDLRRDAMRELQVFPTEILELTKVNFTSLSFSPYPLHLLFQGWGYFLKKSSGSFFMSSVYFVIKLHSLCLKILCFPFSKFAFV